MSHRATSLALSFLLAGFGTAFADNPADPQKPDAAYARLQAKAASTRPVARTPTRTAAAKTAAATQPAARVPSIGGDWEEAANPDLTIFQSHLTIAQAAGKWTSSGNQVWAARKQIRAVGGRDFPRGPREFQWQIDNGTVTSEGKIKAKLHFAKAPPGASMWQVLEGKLSADSRTIVGTVKWDGGSRQFTWSKQILLPLPKLGDTEAGLVAYARNTPKRSLHTISESADEKMVELIWTEPGSLGTPGLPNSGSDSAFGTVATYTIRGGKIVQIDRP